MTGAVQEYTVRVPRSSQKHHCIMQFNSSLMVDFAKWNNVKMVREVPIKHIIEEDSPKFGAGSEFGKDAREEARKKKFGYVTKKHPKEKYPWMMKVGGKLGKRYRGVRGGSITENASYYVFTQAKDGAFEAFPVSEWYNFQHVQRYKALSAEEAEEQFNKRDKIMNYFSVMMKKRLKKEDDAEVDGEKAEEKVGKKKGKDLKISDMDEWPDSSDDNNSSNEENSDQEEKKKKKKDDAKNKSKRKFRKSNIKDEAFEDSDDGDEEGREMDYISDSSESGQEEKQEKEEKGVDQEDALKRLLDSDAEVEASSEEEKNEEEEDENKSDGEDTSPVKKKVSKEKASKTKSSQKDENSSGASDSGDSCSMDQTDYASSSTKNVSDKNTVDGKITAAATKKKTEQLLKDIKRKADDDISPSAPKRAKVEFASSLQISNDTGITEDAVRRYLTRKPMTTTELLQKFKSKKVGLSSDQLVPVIAQILKKINPTKQMVKGKMYLSIKK